ncbi:A24 family peptidase [Allosphingosinicella sp.]|uniref:A24 family peptidase n=1 Tax=Allosphingosinicella sp. TaxID=2823234 RepID=UPI002FC1F387
MGAPVDRHQVHARWLRFSKQPRLDLLVMPGVIANILVAILAAMLLVAATGDFRSRTIPNWLNASIALSAIPFWWMTGLALWPEVAVQVAVAAAVLLLFALAFHFGAMGGGDVKMVAALALWLPPGAVLKLLVIMSLAGGALTLAMLVRHKMTKSQGQLEIPYGAAIAFGGLWLISERYLNQFG